MPPTAAARRRTLEDERETRPSRWPGAADAESFAVNKLKVGAGTRRCASECLAARRRRLGQRRSRSRRRQEGFPAVVVGGGGGASAMAVVVSEMVVGGGVDVVVAGLGCAVGATVVAVAVLILITVQRAVCCLFTAAGFAHGCARAQAASCPAYGRCERG